MPSQICDPEDALRPVLMGPDIFQHEKRQRNSATPLYTMDPNIPGGTSKNPP